ncbi:sulfotransferase family 2 domain-containing protein [Candidatus Pelagibacter sp.]|uniref:sulfotransferase family 2 domain-containing protein n=1 Tax=Candidatus Pelagibacter sp. TaxID=2024849 RepID=UPI003F8265CB
MKLYPNNLFRFLFPKKFNNKRVVHYHIMKTGGTSINQYFYSLLNNKDFDNIEIKFPKIKDYQQENFKKSSAGNKIYMISNRHGGNVSGNNYIIAKSKILRKLNLFSYIHQHNLSLTYLKNKKYFCFSVIREPGSRFMSLFKNLYKNHFNNELYVYGDFYKKFDDIEIYNNPKKFIERIKENKFLFFNQIHTFSKNLNIFEALENIKRLDFLLNQSNLNEHFDLLVKKLELKTTNLDYVRKSDVKIDENFLNELKELFYKNNEIEVEFYKRIQNLKLNNF